MGLAGEVDSLLRKREEIGLTAEEYKELRRLWNLYRELNQLYGVRIRSFGELEKGVMLSEKGEKPRGS